MVSFLNPDSESGRLSALRSSGSLNSRIAHSTPPNVSTALHRSRNSSEAISARREEFVRAWRSLTRCVRVVNTKVPPQGREAPAGAREESVHNGEHPRRLRGACQALGASGIGLTHHGAPIEGFGGVWGWTDGRKFKIIKPSEFLVTWPKLFLWGWPGGYPELGIPGLSHLYCFTIFL